MYVIVRASGHQFKAEKGATVRLPLMNAEPGTKVTFGEVLLASDGGTVTTGTPLIPNASVEAEVISRGLIRTHWNKSQLAKELGISRSSLIQKCAYYGLERKD